ncbi:hypothetical protein DFH09DRAFT_1456642 [Mycena vulgaris]|nr:hypothetical protein DFH09DRAFT_1456642 [Mycena vulgaris]
MRRDVRTVLVDIHAPRIRSPSMSSLEVVGVEVKPGESRRRLLTCASTAKTGKAKPSIYIKKGPEKSVQLLDGELNGQIPNKFWVEGGWGDIFRQLCAVILSSEVKASITHDKTVGVNNRPEGYGLESGRRRFGGSLDAIEQTGIGTREVAPLGGPGNYTLLSPLADTKDGQAVDFGLWVLLSPDFSSFFVKLEDLAAAVATIAGVTPRRNSGW